MWSRAGTACASVPVLAALAGRSRRWAGQSSHAACEERRPPSSVDVLVIGGGIAGASTALHLAKLRLGVALVDRQTCGSGATGLSCATLEILGRGDGSDVKASLATSTLEELRLLEAAGHQCGLQECACLTLARTDEELRWAQEDLQHQLCHGYEGEMLTPQAARDIEPALTGAPITGALCTRGAYADPGATMEALVEAASQAGCCICENCEVVGAARTGPRRWLVRTSMGEVACDDVVVCAGAWAGDLGRAFGLDVPVVRVQAQMMVAEVDPEAPSLSNVVYGVESHAYWEEHGRIDAALRVPRAVTHSPAKQRYCNHVYGRPAPESGCLRTQYEVWFGGDRLPLVDGKDSYEVDEQAAAENLANVAGLLPALGLSKQGRDTQTGPQFWAGVIGPTVHGGLLVGEVLFSPGLWLCTGFGGSGFMQGVGAGVALARRIAGKAESLPLWEKADPTPWVRATACESAL